MSTSLPDISLRQMVTLSGLTEASAYAIQLAQTEMEIHLAQRLRYEVFNLELKEGLAESEHLERDVDAFDSCCDHLLVWHRPSQTVVGTYRLQSGARAEKNLGFYSAQEFDFAPYEKIRPELLELGRACVHRDHRNLVVLHALWRGIAHYAQQFNLRYLIGCSSLTSQDDNLGWAMYQRLSAAHLVEQALQTAPLPDFALQPTKKINGPPPPKLLRAYLGLGAKIAGPPALDREFKTIDFLTLLDLNSLPAAVRHHFFN